MQLGDYLNSINFTKEDLMAPESDPSNEKGYLPFIVNKTLSYFQDCILYSNEMNRRHQLDKKMQFDFFLHAIRKRKRFSKWTKKNKEDYIELIKEAYGYSNEKAEQVLDILTDHQLEHIQKFLDKGGNTKKKK